MCILNCLDGELQKIVEANGWSVDNGVVYIRSQEELIKPKRILPKIDFDSEIILLLHNACK